MPHDHHHADDNDVSVGNCCRLLTFGMVCLSEMRELLIGIANQVEVILGDSASRKC